MWRAAVCESGKEIQLSAVNGWSHSAGNVSRMNLAHHTQASGEGKSEASESMRAWVFDEYVIWFSLSCLDRRFEVCFYSFSLQEF